MVEFGFKRGRIVHAIGWPNNFEQGQIDCLSERV
ncbi:MAG: hypothetical protein RL240_771 [Planctomycetota bacterium]